MAVTVALVSNDGHSIRVPQELAHFSKTIRVLLQSVDDSSGNNIPEILTFSFPSTIPASRPVLDEVVRYMEFKQRWDGKPDAPQFDLNLDILHDLTIVADYLDI